MGLFSNLFGKTQSVRAALARDLAISRVGYIPFVETGGEETADLYEVMKRMSEEEILKEPEGMVVSLVHSYSELIRQKKTHSASLKHLEAQQDRVGLRSMDVGEMSLDEYVAYRLSVVLPSGPLPGMDEYWFNRCMSMSTERFKVPWQGGATDPPAITRAKRPGTA